MRLEDDKGNDKFKAHFLTLASALNRGCSPCVFIVVDVVFSNSLIIHQEETKKITAVTVVWICVPNYHKILPTLALIFSKNY